jgi:hypothetical protein
MDMILDRLDPNKSETEELSRASALLYGMIHARYIISPRGLDAMLHKLKSCCFGECPRHMCDGQAVLPMGLYDDPQYSHVKLFCPKCGDSYNCNPNQRHIDGSFFGTTFAHLFLLHFHDVTGIVPEPTKKSYVPKVFGFKIHNSKSVNRTMNISSSGSSNSSNGDTSSVGNEDCDGKGNGTGKGTGKKVVVIKKVFSTYMAPDLEVKTDSAKEKLKKGDVAASVGSKRAAADEVEITSTSNKKGKVA